MKVFVLTILAGSILAAGCGAAFHSGTPRANALEGAVADVWISSEDRALPIYYVEGQNYLLGEEGNRYAICLKNKVDSRVEAVISVDGRDVVSGRIADYKQDRGYVLLSGEQVCIEGFRQSLNEVAAFEFTRPADSYAARMGSAGNVGVIGIALFAEISAPAPPVAIASEEPGPIGQSPVSAPSADGADLKRAGQAEDSERGLGTGYGGGVDSRAEMVSFSRQDAEQPQELIVLYYDDREGLERMGVVFTEETDRAPRPNPFPGIRDADGGFAPPPPR
jgi:hypothetical protein